MAQHNITREEVFEAAKTIAAAGKSLTLDEVRAYLGGRGSQSTLHKYLKQWKQACFQKGIVDAIEGKEYQRLLEEKYGLERLIAKQVEQNETLTSQLIKSEQKRAEAREKMSQFEIEIGQLKERYLHLEIKHQALEQAYRGMHDERESAIQAILADKNQLIESLRQELKEVNQASLKEVREMGYKGDEALMEEKVKTLNLKDKVAELEKRAEVLQQQLAREQQANQPLRHEIEKQRRLIEKVVTFEQLQAYKESE